jgi:hypothetical protein
VRDVVKRTLEEQKVHKKEYNRQWRIDHKDIVQQETRDYYVAHREEKIAYGKKYQEENKEALAIKRKANQHRYGLANHYGITEEEYTILLTIQGGKCAVCGGDNSMSRQSMRLFVDHDHLTGRVRGLLCSNCNQALGYVHDDPELLLKLIEYLKSEQTPPRHQ